MLTAVCPFRASVLCALCSVLCYIADICALLTLFHVLLCALSALCSVLLCCSIALCSLLWAFLVAIWPAAAAHSPRPLPIS
jgi:hypothetical protein